MFATRSHLIAKTTSLAPKASSYLGSGVRVTPFVWTRYERRSHRSLIFRSGSLSLFIPPILSGVATVTSWPLFSKSLGSKRGLFHSSEKQIPQSRGYSTSSGGDGDPKTRWWKRFLDRYDPILIYLPWITTIYLQLYMRWPHYCFWKMNTTEFSCVNWDDPSQTAVQFRRLLRAYIQYYTSGIHDASIVDILDTLETIAFFLLPVPHEHLENFVSDVFSDDDVSKALPLDIDKFNKTVEASKARMHEAMRLAAHEIHELFATQPPQWLRSDLGYGSEVTEEVGKLFQEAMRVLFEVCYADELAIQKVLAIMAVHLKDIETDKEKEYREIGE
ncbi:MAG: hypothetical protein NXY57DRAFT_1012635 [Lentinula lateritia]|uniref:Uncharacterized protein n=1 Tax=Lentinula lateritia TaxID=40482 RepID=A0ABQ8VW03_9AGAR|nr:MAG: hypothetical protein NXY57DRAFT_1012635 [Lentinula lateritia]KAJ4500201.1 hypothetical protein C8R41DRAFT_977805 [Lentinula lateritia]